MNRLQNLIDAVSPKVVIAAKAALRMIASHERGRDADAGFDSGEFSGPAHDRAIDKELDAIAKKYGVSRHELESEMARIGNEGVKSECRLENLIDEALPVLDPKSGQMKNILARMRRDLHLPPDEAPVWKQYLVYRIQSRSADANKYHYFAVFDNGERCVAANAFGRIGSVGGVKKLGDFATREAAVRAAEKKILVKMKKGYDVQEL